MKNAVKSSRMHFLTASSCAALALATGVCVAAAGQPNPGDLAPMRFMLGSWTCSGKALDGSPFSLTQMTTIQPAGSAQSAPRLVTRDSQGKSTTTLWWNADKQVWMQTSESSNGSSTQTSTGWAGDSLVFTGTITVAGTGTLGYRSTTTKVSDAKTQQLDELAKPDGGWVTFDTGVCEKNR
jgi:hypothetical protein